MDNIFNEQLEEKILNQLMNGTHISYMAGAYGKPHEFYYALLDKAGIDYSELQEANRYCKYMSALMQSMHYIIKNKRRPRHKNIKEFFPKGRIKPIVQSLIKAGYFDTSNHCKIEPALYDFDSMLLLTDETIKFCGQQPRNFNYSFYHKKIFNAYCEALSLLVGQPVHQLEITRITQNRLTAATEEEAPGMHKTENGPLTDFQSELNNRKQKLIDEYKALSLNLGRIPLQHDLVAAGIYARCKRHFGGYRNFIRQTNFTPPSAERTEKIRLKKKEAEKHLIEELKNFYHKYNRIPLKKDINKHCTFPSKKYLWCFGSLTKARQEAGLPHSHLQKFSNEWMLQHLKELYQSNKPVSHAVIKKAGKVSGALYIRRFGSLRKALTLAGLPFYIVYKRYSRQQLEQRIISFYETVKRPLTKKDFREHIRLQAVHVKRFWGTVEQACAATGIPFSAHKSRKGTKRYTSSTLVPQYTDEQLIAYLKEITNLKKRPAAVKDIYEDNKISIYIFYKRFGSLTNALVKAGIQTKTEFSRQQLIDFLKTIQLKHGKVSTML
jgi:hypothetical protein